MVNYLADITGHDFRHGKENQFLRRVYKLERKDVPVYLVETGCHFHGYSTFQTVFASLDESRAIAYREKIAKGKIVQHNLKHFDLDRVSPIVKSIVEELLKG